MMMPPTQATAKRLVSKPGLNVVNCNLTLFASRAAKTKTKTLEQQTEKPRKLSNPIPNPFSSASLQNLGLLLEFQAK